MKYYLSIFLIFLLSSCSNTKESLYGYVEAEYLYLSPSSSGYLKKLYVKEGDYVKKGDQLFALDETLLKADLEKSNAQLYKAKANLSNLLKGKRKEELLVLEKKLAKANSELENSRLEYERAKHLVGEGAVSQSYFDKWQATYNSNLANYDSAKAEIEVAKLESRSDEIDVARADILLHRQNIISAEKNLVDSSATSPADAFVQETYFQEGEHVKASQAVINLLVPEEIKIIFYVPQNLISSLKLGDEITINCDECSEAYKAKISFISSKAEFSPPIIYSNESRKKLVYLIEARFLDEGIVLSPGLPVDIQLNP
ncbi:MAG: HlyD family efflux transporter periplasmic adaptor subunit [Candidatus Caenarcaniphilales bacterium]|nr:HlyD family efflux transporter periplasmic adaptor subunit [Candidatus Caenarcaniphilales bacterium]